jgi:hypothetical protein
MATLETLTSGTLAPLAVLVLLGAAVYFFFIWLDGLLGEETEVDATVLCPGPSVVANGGVTMGYHVRAAAGDLFVEPAVAHDEAAFGEGDAVIVSARRGRWTKIVHPHDLRADAQPAAAVPRATKTPAKKH